MPAQRSDHQQEFADIRKVERSKYTHAIAVAETEQYRVDREKARQDNKCCNDHGNPYQVDVRDRVENLHSQRDEEMVMEKSRRVMVLATTSRL